MHVVDVHQPGSDSTGLEQLRLGREVRLLGPVEVEVVTPEVGEHRDARSGWRRPGATRGRATTPPSRRRSLPPRRNDDSRPGGRSPPGVVRVPVNVPMTSTSSTGTRSRIEPSIDDDRASCRWSRSLRRSTGGPPGGRTTSAAAVAIADRTSATINCGTPTSSSRSHSTATAPASTARAAKSWPSTCAPGTQQNSEPGTTARESWVTISTPTDRSPSGAGAEELGQGTAPRFPPVDTIVLSPGGARDLLRFPTGSPGWGST